MKADVPYSRSFSIMAMIGSVNYNILLENI